MIKTLNEKWTEHHNGVPVRFRIVGSVSFMNDPNVIVPEPIITFDKKGYFTPNSIQTQLTTICNGTTTITDEISDPILYILWHLLNWTVNWNTIIPKETMENLLANPMYQGSLYPTISLVIEYEQMFQNRSESMMDIMYTMKECLSEKKQFDIIERLVVMEHTINYLELGPDLLSQFYPAKTLCQNGVLYWAEKMNDVTSW